jgi:hypothetical protein
MEFWSIGGWKCIGERKLLPTSEILIQEGRMKCTKNLGPGNDKELNNWKILRVKIQFGTNKNAGKLINNRYSQKEGKEHN